MTVRLFQVGGSVRDELLGLKSKDIDFAVECMGYAELLYWLAVEGFDIFLNQPEFMTARARFPKGFTFAGKEFSGVTADFVVCRKEAHYSDSRHPDSIGVGTIFDDLARRDFTMNAIAIDENGEFLDPHNGRYDLERKLIRPVGNAYERIREDPLRILRALRFSITKNMTIGGGIHYAMEDPAFLAALVQSVSVERVREELDKMFKKNTFLTMRILMIDFPDLGKMIFTNSDIWLKPTLESR